MILAENRAAPLRFLIVVAIGWVTVRGLMLSGWTPTLASMNWAAGPRWSAVASRPWHATVPRRAAPTGDRTPETAAADARRIGSERLRSSAGGPPRGATRPAEVTMRDLAPVGDHRPEPTVDAGPAVPHETGTLTGDAITGAGSTPPGPAMRGRSRWSGSGWAFVRGGGHAAPLSPVGQIGAGQAGVRVLYRLAGGLSLSGRVSRTIGGPDQTEAAGGIDWQPLARIPVHLTAERRVAIDHGGRDAFALGAAGGVYALPLAPGWRLDGYGEAGVVGARRRDGYADGAVRVGRALDLGDGRSLTLGGGAWGAAQPRAARLDVGPSAVLRLPVERRTIALALDYRARVLGDARPHSGVALTVGIDF